MANRYEIVTTKEPLQGGEQHLVYDSQFGFIGGPSDPSNVLCVCTSKEYAEQVTNALNALTASPTPAQSDKECAEAIIALYREADASVDCPKEAARLITAHRTAATGWLPIEDCPKQARTLYLVYGPWAGEINGIDSGDCGPFVAEYGGDKYQGDYEGFKWIVSGTDGYAAWCNPTHYMPLPPAPMALNPEKEEK